MDLIDSPLSPHRLLYPGFLTELQTLFLSEKCSTEWEEKCSVSFGATANCLEQGGLRWGRRGGGSEEKDTGREPDDEVTGIQTRLQGRTRKRF